MDGRPFVNHIHVVPIQGEHTQVATTSTVIGKKINPHLALAAAAGVTHCLWYMDVHEAVTQKDAMSDVFYPNSAKVMTSTVAPFDILDINLAWSKACMLPRSAVIGKTLSLVQGPATDQNMTSELCKKALATKSHYTEIINYRADGQPFINRLQIYPVLNNLGSTSGITSTSSVGIIKQSMSSALDDVLLDGAHAALVVSAEYPHAVVHANAAWLEKMIPDYMRAESTADIVEKFVGQPLSGIALAASHSDSQEEEDGSGDLMKLTKGGDPTRILLTHYDALTGCGAWAEAAVAAIQDVDLEHVTHLVLSLDLALAVPTPTASAVKALLPTLSRTHEDPVMDMYDRKDVLDIKALMPTGSSNNGIAALDDDEMFDEVSACQEPANAELKLKSSSRKMHINEILRRSFESEEAALGAKEMSTETKHLSDTTNAIKHRIPQRKRDSRFCEDKQEQGTDEELATTLNLQSLNLISGLLARTCEGAHAGTRFNLSSFESEEEEEEEENTGRGGGEAVVPNKTAGLLMRTCEVSDSHLSCDEDCEEADVSIFPKTTAGLLMRTCEVFDSHLSCDEDCEEEDVSIFPKTTAGLLMRTCEVSDSRLSWDDACEEEDVSIFPKKTAGLLMRTCEVSDLRLSCDENCEEEDVSIFPKKTAGLLMRTCEVSDSRLSCDVDCEEEEEYMDSEEEQELMGCQLPEAEVLSALRKLLLVRPESDDEEEEEEEESMEERNLALSDKAFFQAICAHKNHPLRYDEEEQRQDLMTIEAINDDADETAPGALFEYIMGQYTAAEQHRTEHPHDDSTESEMGDDESESEDTCMQHMQPASKDITSEMQDSCVSEIGVDGKTALFRDKFASNSDVFTSVRVHVAQVCLFAPVCAPQDLKNLQKKNILRHARFLSLLLLLCRMAQVCVCVGLILNCFFVWQLECVPCRTKILLLNACISLLAGDARIQSLHDDNLLLNARISLLAG